jgi:TonB-dependent receptor
MKSHRISLILLVSILLIAVCFPAVAQKAGSLSGLVKDAQTGDPLPGTNVVFVGTSIGGTTNIYGKYAIQSIPPGTYTVRATYIGYTTRDFPVVIAEGAEAHRDFSLSAVAIEGETVTITAQAAGQNQAINQQLSSNQISNVVSSARIQELPDANAAESIGRLPGVAVLRSGGEGNEIVIRGLAPKYNDVNINGIRIASSDPDDRSADLSMISSNMLEGIEVSKSVTADMDADVIGGTVNFRLKEARESETGAPAMDLLIQGGYNGLSNAYHKYNNYKIVGSVESRFLDQQLGIFAQANVERKNLTSNEFGASYDHLRNSLVDYAMTGLTLNYIPRDRQRANGTLVLDYRLPEGKINFTNFGSTGSTDIQNRSEYYDIGSNLHQYNLGYSKSTMNIITNALEVEHQVSFIHANAKLSHTYAERKSPGDWTATFTQSSAGLAPFSGLANVDPYAIPPAANNDLSRTVFSSMITNSSFSRERAFAASLDLESSLSLTDLITTKLKVGGKYRHQTRSYVYEQQDGQGLTYTSSRVVDDLITSHFGLPTGTTTMPIGWFMDPSYNYGEFLDGDFRMGAPLHFGMLSETAQLLRDNLAYIGANGGSIAFSTDNFLSTTNNYDGDEDVSGAYAMATINIGPQITVIPGVRYQHITTTYAGSQGVESPVAYQTYQHFDTTVTQRHGFWLPNLSLRYRPLTWCDVRLAYSQTLSYPDYNAIVPRIDVATSSIAYNNAELVPSRSSNFDAYVSVYDNSIGLFTVGGFLKRIDNLIYPWTFYASGAKLTQYYPSRYLGSTPPTGIYKVTTFVNDSYRIENWGIEFDWQTHFWYLPAPFSGLVLNVNYTHIFSKAEYPYVDVQSTGRVVTYTDTSFTDRLLYQPDNIFNLSVGYDLGGFSARISVLYQADIFTGPNYWPQLRTNTSPYTRWDLSVKQDLPWLGLQVFGNLNNINGASDVSVIQAVTGVPRAQQQYGMSADLGIRWRME